MNKKAAQAYYQLINYNKIIEILNLNEEKDYKKIEEYHLFYRIEEIFKTKDFLTKWINDKNGDYYFNEENIKEVGEYILKHKKMTKKEEKNIIKQKINYYYKSAKHYQKAILNWTNQDTINFYNGKRVKSKNCKNATGSKNELIFCFENLAYFKKMLNTKEPTIVNRNEVIEEIKNFQ